LPRVSAYIDGYNLYYGLRSKHWQRYYWLNIAQLAQLMLKPNQQLSVTKYFTTIVKRPDDRRLRQAAFIEALQTLPNFRIYYGQFLEDQIACRKCGHTYTTYHEKMTDVNISVELMADAYQNKFDTALLISADSDLVGPLRAVRQLFPNKELIVVFPPNRSSYALRQVAHQILHIGHNELAKSQFPQTVIKSDGIALQCPASWR
jgi:uncharacterized LabA/DUF88 family protein